MVGCFAHSSCRSYLFDPYLKRDSICSKIDLFWFWIVWFDLFENYSLCVVSLICLIFSVSVCEMWLPIADALPCWIVMHYFAEFSSPLLTGFLGWIVVLQLARLASRLLRLLFCSICWTMSAWSDWIWLQISDAVAWLNGSIQLAGFGSRLLMWLCGLLRVTLSTLAY